MEVHVALIAKTTTMGSTRLLYCELWVIWKKFFSKVPVPVESYRKHGEPSTLPFPSAPGRLPEPYDLISFLESSPSMLIFSFL